ncbi:UdgX family uracil-DNA binding protein [Desertibaculum subflavum]|uniref:UdgX family uracil-DNA binding protein n=1 Tax=Desertibaculum subflavum TaxID=2268458 RepID=UPI0034D2AAE2
MARAAHRRHGDEIAAPARPSSRQVDALAAKAKGCTRCPLYRNATQTVFGEGPTGATLMLVGEQPGDQEDRAGRPFVGPAGKLLDRALVAAGIDRLDVYVTNVVKHFKHERRGKRRLHKRPNREEIDICRWWLDLELQTVRPRLVIALGVTAASALAGRAIVLSRVRRKTMDFTGLKGMAIQHPSALLRIPDSEARHRAFDTFVADLQYAAASVS